MGPGHTPPAPPVAPAGRRRYWVVSRRLILALLALWFGLTVASTYFARELAFDFFGWPFSFWLAAQGVPLLYLAIVVVHAVVMAHWDRQHDVHEGD
jgi:putative solute:sodium symporter small subunit